MRRRRAMDLSGKEVSKKDGKRLSKGCVMTTSFQQSRLKKCFSQKRNSRLQKQLTHRLAAVGDRHGPVAGVEFLGWVDAQGAVNRGVKVGN